MTALSTRRGRACVNFPDSASLNAALLGCLLSLGRLMTGHAESLITLNLSEADPAARKQARTFGAAY